MQLDSLITNLTSNILFPVYHILLRDGLWKIIVDYEKSQWLPFDKLVEIQQQKLKRLIIHCQSSVPYYQNIFENIGLEAYEQITYDKFRIIPFLTKSLINENRDKILSVGVKKRDLIKNSTSGSTGETLRFFQDKKSSPYRQAVVWRNFKWVSCKYTDRKASLWGAPFDLSKRESIHGRLHSFFNRSLALSSYNLSSESMFRYAKILLKYEPKVLISYPSPLATFAEFLAIENLYIPSIKSIITSAETLYSWQRDIIEEAFQCQVFDRYGCREFGNIAHECDSHEGYHVNMERFLLEILDSNGNPVLPGQLGEIFVTDLDNYAFPFIRYKIGDMAIPSAKLCSCGRGLSLLERVEGRTFDIIRAPNGNKVAGTFWTLAMRSIPGVQNFQVEQVSLKKLILRIVQDKHYSIQSERIINDLIRDKCGDGMQIKITYVDHIPLTKSGKKRFVISHLS